MFTVVQDAHTYCHILQLVKPSGQITTGQLENMDWTLDWMLDWTLSS